MSGIRTLAIVKPDAMAHVCAIINRIAREGFVIRAQTRVRLGPLDVDNLYREHMDRDFYQAMREFMMSGDVVLMVLERADAVAAWRKIIGPTDPRRAHRAWFESVADAYNRRTENTSYQTLRAMYGDRSDGAPMFRNAVHGSDSDTAAEREIAQFFGPSKLEPTYDVDDIYAISQLPHGASVPEKMRTAFCAALSDADIRWIVDVGAELARGRAKHPTGHFLFAALLEEMGELALALIERDATQIRKEAIQCACVALRIAQDGDPTHYAPTGVLSLGYHLGAVARGLLQRHVGNAEFALASVRAMALRMKSDHDAGKSLDATFDTLTDEEAKP